MPFPLRLAVGLLSIHPDADGYVRRQARIELALVAAGAGYALVEVFEVGGRGTSEAAALEELETVAHQVDAVAVIWIGDVDLVRLRDIADRLRLVTICA